jgi:hypothetical protein
LDKELNELKLRNQQAVSAEEAEAIRRRDAVIQDYMDQNLLKAFADNPPDSPNPTKQSIINPSNIGGLKNPIGESPASPDSFPTTGLPIYTLPTDPKTGFKADLIESNFIPSKPGANNLATIQSGFEQHVPNYYENSEALNYGYGPNPASYIPPEKSYLGPNPRLSKDDFVKLLRRVGA